MQPTFGARLAVFQPRLFADGYDYPPPPTLSARKATKARAEGFAEWPAGKRVKVDAAQVQFRQHAHQRSGVKLALAGAGAGHDDAHARGGGGDRALQCGNAQSKRSCHRTHIRAIGQREVHSRLGADLPQFNREDSWILPMPARYVIGRDGVVADYTRRPQPSDICLVLDQLRDCADARGRA
jgi:hypothetical protein